MCDLHGKIGVASEFSVSDHPQLSVFRHQTPVSGSGRHRKARSPSRRLSEYLARVTTRRRVFSVSLAELDVGSSRSHLLNST